MVLGLLLVFFVGYLAITFEGILKINKSAIALVTAVLCWSLIIFDTPDKNIVLESLSHHLSEISEILFFLLGAMTIVELIDAHDGFQNIVDRIKTTHKAKLIWLIALITFFLAAVLDNLTGTIVMASILNKLLSDQKTKWSLIQQIRWNKTPFPK